MTLNELQTQGHVQNMGMVKVKDLGKGWGLLRGPIAAGTPPGA